MNHNEYRQNRSNGTSLNNLHWPKDVGIKAIEFYVPKLYVSQTELEKHDQVSTGKYTEGLGQKQMGFCSDPEDINSLCLTVFDALMSRNNLKYEDIGRVDVGTETIIDKSKSVKTVLMDLFKESGNFNVEGLDTTNACYGGTAALFNALNWIESSAWDGRMAVVVAGDIAVYAKGNARPTGGAGTVAMLVGPDASLVIDRGLRATYMTNVYDFYKPDLTSEYPVVDGLLSIKCYLSALDACYDLYKKKSGKLNFDIDHFDAFVFHSPYCKLVQKSLARLLFNDYLRVVDKEAKFPGLDELKEATLENSYLDKNVEKVFMKLGAGKFTKMTEPSLLLASRVGNMYTASVYGCLVSYLANTPVDELTGKRIGVFSYGSGLASSMYSLTIRDGVELDKLVANAQQIKKKLEERKQVSPVEFSTILEQRAATLHEVPFKPHGSIDDLFTGTWYIQQIDEKHRRSYSKKS